MKLSKKMSVGINVGILIILSGCQTLIPDRGNIEFEHISHPGSGWPFGPSTEEATLTQFAGTLTWETDIGYLSTGLGYNIDRSGDFYGSRVTGSFRIGKEFRFK